MSFNPNQISLEDGIELIKKSQKEMGLSQTEIFTSHDAEAKKASALLNTTTVPNGFNKWMLPFYTDGPATFFISSAAPQVKVPEHAHEEGAGIRFIMSGSIKYKDQILKEGDWMYVPAKANYEFEVGPMGTTMCYCYQCCCQQK